MAVSLRWNHKSWPSTGRGLWDGIIWLHFRNTTSQCTRHRVLIFRGRIIFIDVNVGILRSDLIVIAVAIFEKLQTVSRWYTAFFDLRETGPHKPPKSGHESKLPNFIWSITIYDYLRLSKTLNISVPITLSEKLTKGYILGCSPCCLDSRRSKEAVGNLTALWANGLSSPSDMKELTN